MNLVRTYIKRYFSLLVISIVISGCGETITEKDFVGKWKSSKLETPVYLYENGEWEIKTESGAILQYGVWEYRNSLMTWSFKVNSQIGHDVNQVITVAPREFRLKESDGSITTFSRLD